jgi:nitrate/TMAO reductase-like tetraheme cytochrome c subunit
MNVRKVLLVLLVLGVAGAAALLVLPAPEKGADPARSREAAPAAGTVAADADGPAARSAGGREAFTKAAECRQCHEALYAEWHTSMHGQAWTDPMVQGLSNGFRMTECIDCHAPMPIHETGISQRVAPRQHSRGDGVDCLTCHLMEDGVSVAATRTVDTSATPGACRPVAVPEMSTAAACAGCHNQHFTVDEVAQSGVKETCSDCHMPQTERAGKKGRSHLWPGAHSLEMHRKAVTLDLAIEQGAVVATVKNVGGAHQVPTDARHRSYNVFLSATDERGNPLVADKMIGEFRLYYRDDFKPSTQIAFGKSGQARWPVPEGLKGTAKVRLAYALNPEELAKRNVLPVLEKEIAFP